MRLSRAFWALEEIRREVPGSRLTWPPLAEPEPAEVPEAGPEPVAAKPEPAAARPEEPQPPEPKAAEAKPTAAEPPAVKADEPKPNLSAAPPGRSFERMRTPEEQRADQEHKARMLAKYYNGL